MKFSSLSFLKWSAYFSGKIALVFGIVLAAQVSSAAIPEEVRPLSEIRTEHPRLFVYSGDLQKMRERARGEAKEEYEKLRKAVDALPPEAPLIFLENRFTELPDGSIQPDIASRSGSQMVRYNGGDQAAQAAFLYLLDGRKKDLEKAKNYLRLANEVILWSAERAKVWIGWR
ncbi:MAG TPA: hypothetical protein VK041_07865, partial [Opitutales bacterium]|nr:hypothetical protein [Opitutales bacterium]